MALRSLACTASPMHVMMLPLRIWSGLGFPEDCEVAQILQARDQQCRQMFVRAGVCRETFVASATQGPMCRPSRTLTGQHMPVIVSPK